MFQGDCLLSFAIGSALATAAGDGLKVFNYKTQNKYFVFLLIHLSMIVRPLNIYMVWEHTGFDSLFYLDASMSGVLPAVTVFASMLSGIIGFMLSRKLIFLDKELTSYTVWTTAFSLYFGFSAVHYDRLLYPGGIKDFYDGKNYAIWEFFNSQIFVTMLAKTALTMAPVHYAQIYWPREEGLLTKSRKSTIVRHCLKCVIYQGIFITTVVVVVKVSNLLSPDTWSWDRVVAAMCGQLITGVLLVVPVLLMSTKYVVTKRIDIRRSKQQVQKSMKRRRQPRTEYPRIPISHQNGSINDEMWEENSEYSVPDNDEQPISMNGEVANHIVESDAKTE